MKVWIIGFLFFVLIPVLKGQSILDSCYNFTAIQEQYFEKIPNIEDCKKHILDKRNLDLIYSQENLNTIIKAIRALPDEIECENMDQINVVLFHQDQHSLDYLYITVLSKNENKYYFKHPHEEKLKYLGSNNERDYISYVFDRLYKLNSYFTMDYAIYINMTNNKIIEQLATQTFSFHVHYQILASVGNLISCEN